MPAKIIHIEYDTGKCIGAQKCVQIAPDFFSFNGQKAALQGSQRVEGKHILTLECGPGQVEQFIQTASSCPVNAIKVTDEKEILVGTDVVAETMQEVVAHYDDDREFVLDPQGYFLIRIDAVAQTIEVGFCNARNKVVLKVVGGKPLDIYQTIINKLELEIRKDHCAYLGRELQKAYIALQQKVSYVQDDELRL